jgi:DMSO reductase family type II enzyme heme b subunit
MKRPLLAAWTAWASSFILTACLAVTAATGSAPTPSPADRIDAGRAVYDQQCATCHGLQGDGNGPAAVWLYPKPRNFAAGLFKIQSTPPGSLPTDADLGRSITRGLPGSSMPSFSYLSETQRQEVVAYVKHLTTYTNEAGQRVNRFAEAAATGRLASPVEVPPEPPATVAALALGREVYGKMQCANCHGETGAGDGPQVPSLKDSFGLPVRPRDFNTGSFRGGHTGRDLYLRIKNGLAGTPMVPYGDDVLKPDERWALVHFVQSLRRSDVAVNDLLTPEDGLIPVRRISRLPEDPLDPVWESFDAVRVPLNPLWPEPELIYAVAVSALHDGQRIAILCQWKDDLPNGTPIRVLDFQDAAALQFSLTGRFPFLGMGDADNPVNLWLWRAGAQVASAGHRDELRDAYQALHVDTYFATQYLTAVSAGNPIAQPQPSAVEDANARGFGSFQSQPLDQQNVQGRSVWSAGAWNVVFIRELASRETGDVKLTPGRVVPVALAIWNGEQRDRNGRKVISNWYQLALE